MLPISNKTLIVAGRGDSADQKLDRDHYFEAVQL